jgi:hypothetical protein
MIWQPVEPDFHGSFSCFRNQFRSGPDARKIFGLPGGGTVCFSSAEPLGVEADQRRSKGNSMNMKIFTSLLAFTVMTTTAPADPDETLGPELRQLAFDTKPSELNFASDEDFPKVYGVVIDWPVEDQIATIVAMRDGTASLYTTRKYGVIGGDSLPAAREAAVMCTRTAGHFLETAKRAEKFPYPQQGEVFFYLLTYDGVYRASAKEAALFDESDPHAVLFAWAQRVLTELQAKK